MGIIKRSTYLTRKELIDLSTELDNKELRDYANGLSDGEYALNVETHNPNLQIIGYEPSSTENYLTKFSEFGKYESDSVKYIQKHFMLLTQRVAKEILPILIETCENRGIDNLDDLSALISSCAWFGVDEVKNLKDKSKIYELDDFNYAVLDYF